MSEPLTIAQLDSTATEWIEREARRTGQPIETIVRRLIYRGLELERKHVQGHRFHDLDPLAGTWSADEAVEFRRAVTELDQVDPSLWQ
jgi:hypothetical protein